MMHIWNSRFTLSQSDAQTAPASRSAMSAPSSWIAVADSIGLESPSCAGMSGAPGIVVRSPPVRWGPAALGSAVSGRSNINEPSGTVAGTNGERASDSTPSVSLAPEW